MARWRLVNRVLEFPPPRAVGIVNVTPDSFFEGARSVTPRQAVEDGLSLVEAGFDLLDIGAVAVASGSEVPPDVEAARLMPALVSLVEAVDVPITVDTFRHEIALGALDAGAAAINDISGGADPGMLDLVAERGCGYVLTHVEGPPRADRRPRHQGDPVEHLARWFGGRIEAALSCGVDEDQVALDPGFDFDLSVEDSLEVLRRLGELRALGRPLFVALSRKDFLGAALTGSWERRAPAADREWATAAATALSVAGGADLVRLHDRSALDALRVAAAVPARGAARARPVPAADG